MTQTICHRVLYLILSLAVVVILILLGTGGYELSIGSTQIAAVHHLKKPLIILLSSLILILLSTKSHEIPLHSAIQSPSLIFLITLLVFTLSTTWVGSGDTMPARYLPFSILKEGNFNFDEFTFLYKNGMPYYLTRVEGHIVSTYPPWPGLLALPVYILPVLTGLSPLSPLVPDLERLSAGLCTALSVVFFFLALRRLSSDKVAWYIAMIYAFGTSSFSISSQGLWQHGISQLFLSIALYSLLMISKNEKFLPYAGLAISCAVITRLSNLMVAIPVSMYIFHKHRKHIIIFILYALLPFVVFLFYNYSYFGSPFKTGFASTVINILAPHGSDFKTSLTAGLAGLLISPGRGLFFYSPILLFSIVGMITIWKDTENILLKYLSVAPFLVILLTGKWGMWWGGHCYGPRLLADILPLLCLFLYPSFELAQERKKLKYLLILLSTVSIGMHTIGAFSDTSWNVHPNNIDIHPERLWSLTESPPVYYLKKLFSSN